MNLLGQVFGFVLCAFVGLLGATIIVWIWQGKIDLSALISESNGQASMSRFQLLIFTFVIAIGLYELIELRVNTTGFPDIPNGVLTLLGISASTYAVGKGISYSQPQTLLTPPASNADSTDVDDAVAAAQAAAGQAAVHAATAQQAVQQSATNAVIAQVAANQATENQP